MGCLRFRKKSLQNLPAEIAGIAVRFIALRNQILCTAIVALDNPVSLRNAVPLIIPHADHTSAGFLVETRLLLALFLRMIPGILLRFPFQIRRCGSRRR